MRLGATIVAMVCAACGDFDVLRRPHQLISISAGADSSDAFAFRSVRDRPLLRRLKVGSSAKLRWRTRPALGDHLGVRTRTVNVSFNIGGRGRLPSPDGTGVGPYEAVTR